MFNLFYFFFCALVISTFAAPMTDSLIMNIFTTEEEANAELRAAGMTQASIDGLDALAKRFSSEFPLVKSDKEATDSYISKYRTDAEKFIKSMPENDQTIYNNYLKKHELA
ncbi:Protein CBG04649 [Caenorhabditis briggsae]|uniref:Protein CBG04649 n=1 Tax=Caenorhabditis briggsae TaxID=6238 RepID=A8WY53_CAEBR|nr:Protein CBG04649 [Caenorhabditis briggsae]CAP25312.1 Protein CBG04649 [Caenorhabditis briggsae]